ncbi:MAG TPA: uracil-DNA glycosylase [Terriglobia bacterium]|nr:uracil-DNA glycosylase [Terriglobia bacterium]
MPDSRRFCLEELKARLEYYQEIGIESLSPQVLTVLNNWESLHLTDQVSAPPSAPLQVVREDSLNALEIPQTPSMFETNLKQAAGDESLEQIRDDLGDCRRCKLWPTRTHIVFGSGNPSAQLVFVGEGPGADEDMQGLPFVGRAGQLLTKIIESINLKREEVYICNVVKCRPPNNRFPEKDEVAACSSFLVRQLEAIKPKVICCLGAAAAQTLLNTKAPIGALRGRFRDYRGTQLMVTYHPAYLLRNPSAKREVWEDMKKIRETLNLEGRG